MNLESYNKLKDYLNGDITFRFDEEVVEKFLEGDLAVPDVGYFAALVLETPADQLYRIESRKHGALENLSPFTMCFEAINTRGITDPFEILERISCVFDLKRTISQGLGEEEFCKTLSEFTDIDFQDFMNMVKLQS